MITLSDEKQNQITLITAEDEPPFQRHVWNAYDNWGPMGIQSIDATEEEATFMLCYVIKYWREFNICADEDVTMDVLVPNEQNTSQEASLA
jgi:hypothetical protein